MEGAREGKELGERVGRGDCGRNEGGRREREGGREGGKRRDINGAGEGSRTDEHGGEGREILQSELQ